VLFGAGEILFQAKKLFYCKTRVSVLFGAGEILFQPLPALVVLRI
jgi:hypothetical protein